MIGEAASWGPLACDVPTYLVISKSHVLVALSPHLCETGLGPK